MILHLLGGQGGQQAVNVRVFAHLPAVLGYLGHLGEGAAALLLRGLRRSWWGAGLDGANPCCSELEPATGAVLCAGSSVPKLWATGPRVSATANKTERPALEGEAGPRRGGPAGCQSA